MVILVKCVEREIDLVGIYKDKEEAYEVMEKDLAKAMEIEVPKDWNKIEIDKDFDISCDSAWINDLRHNNYDWKILQLNESK